MKEGKLIPARKLKNGTYSSKNYTACPKCKIIITKGALRRHYRNNCLQISRYTKNVLTASKALTENLLGLASDTFKLYIFTKFREGIVKETIRFDKILILYANELCCKYRSQHHYPMIRNRIILLAKLLIKMKSMNEHITDFQSILEPRYFDQIVSCINQFGQYDSQTGAYLKPTLPTVLGTALKYVIHLHVAECIKQENPVAKLKANDLLHLLNTALPAHVNKTAMESLLRQKRQKLQTLPSTEDISKMNKYVLQKRNVYFQQLNKEFSYKNWLELSKYTIVSILIFNRRRPGELQRALISDLKSLLTVSKDNSDIFSTLSDRGKRAISEYKRFTIRGKLARGVPVLLHQSMYSCIEKILEYREEAGVHLNNPYIFGLPQVDGVDTNIIFRHLLVTDLIRKFSEKCGAVSPKTLRATNLRKHIATQSVTLNLNDCEISNLQSFLGHADKIHRDYYRQPVAVNDIINMSKLLLIAQGCKDIDGDDMPGQIIGGGGTVLISNINNHVLDIP